jgi:hypothetical protein
VRRHAPCHGAAGPSLQGTDLVSQTSQETRTLLQTLLDGVEQVGNKVPHPAVIFLVLMGVVALLSHAFYLIGTSPSYQRINPQTHELENLTATVNSLLTANGIRFLLTSAVRNFLNFGPVGVIWVFCDGHEDSPPFTTGSCLQSCSSWRVPCRDSQGAPGNTAFKSASGVADLCWLTSRYTSPRPHPEAEPGCRRASDPFPTRMGNRAGTGTRDTRTLASPSILFV